MCVGVILTFDLRESPVRPLVPGLSCSCRERRPGELGRKEGNKASVPEPAGLSLSASLRLPIPGVTAAVHAQQGRDRRANGFRELVTGGKYVA